jgi:hypothetical protein
MHHPFYLLPQNLGKNLYFETTFKLLIDWLFYYMDSLGALHCYIVSFEVNEQNNQQQ